MQLSQALKDALTGQGSVRGKAVTVKQIFDKGVRVGVRSPYVNRHQFGTGGMPKRKVIQVTAAQRIKFAKVLQVALVALERSAFGGVTIR